MVLDGLIKKVIEKNEKADFLKERIEV